MSFIESLKNLFLTTLERLMDRVIKIQCCVKINIMAKLILMATISLK